MSFGDWVRTDLRQAVRALRRRPGHSALAVLTLAVGLGLNTVAFSAVNALVFRPLRMPNADRTGWIFAGPRNRPFESVSLPLFEAIERNARTLEVAAAEGRVPLAFRSEAETRQVWALLVSSRYFDVIPPDIAMGRSLSRSDARVDEAAVVVSERFWRSRLGANTQLSTLTVTLAGRPARVVGVMRDGFQGPGGLFEPDLWAPLAAWNALGLAAEYGDRKTTWLTMVARPFADVRAPAIAFDLLPIVKEFGAGDPGAAQVQFERLADGHPEARALRPAAALGLGAVVVVLLIACFNVAGLLLARSAERQGEFGVRAALGAGRARLVRQLVTEGLVLAAIAGAAALLLANWSAALLSTFSLPAPIPQRLHFSTDWRLVGFAAAVSLLSALLPALAPAWHLFKTDLALSVRNGSSGSIGGRPQARARRAFVTLQVAGSTVFLIAAVLFGRSFASARSAGTGFDTAKTAVMTIEPNHYGYDPARSRALLENLTRRLELQPEVEAAGYADRAPFFVGFPRNIRVIPEGQTCVTSECPLAEVFSADPRYFKALGLPLRLGRLFDPLDPADREAVVVTVAAAAKLWPGLNPIGQRYREQEGGSERMVTGIVADVSLHGQGGPPPRPAIYQAMSESDFGQPITLVARARGNPLGLIALMRERLQELAPGIPPQALETMEQRLALPLWPIRTLALFFGLCGVLSVLLATVGLFAVTHHVVSQRTREFGVRIALGASRINLRRLVLREAMSLVGPGILVGGLLGGGLSALVTSRMVSIAQPTAPVLLTALGLQVLVVAAASWLPAMKASAVDPLIALRAE